MPGAHEVPLGWSSWTPNDILLCFVRLASRDVTHWNLAIHVGHVPHPDL